MCFDNSFMLIYRRFLCNIIMAQRPELWMDIGYSMSKKKKKPPQGLNPQTDHLANNDDYKVL